MKKVLLVFGTRPEAIKMAPVCHEFLKEKSFFNTKICVTAQHREMLDQVLGIFSITPDFDLDLMSPGQDLFDVTSNVLIGMRKIFQSFNPDLILVHGDTSTTFTASMAAFYSGIKVGHVEAGLRTYDISSPFPEEFNRQVTGKLANWHFAPTNQSAQNLLDEKISKEIIHVTGNTVIDALQIVTKKIENESDLRESIKKLIQEELKFEFDEIPFILITGHRRENFGSGFISICESIKDLSNKFKDYQFVYPVHLNPNVQDPVFKILGNLSNVHLIKPLSYEPFIYLLNKCFLVLTDSGGIQEEAPSLGKPVLVMRDTTERPEAVESGNVILVGTNKTKIIDNVQNLINNKKAYEKMSNALNPYGDGNASKRIVKIIKDSYEK